LTEHILSDHDIAVEAIDTKIITAEELPRELQKDKSFLLRLLRRSWGSYRSIREATYLLMNDEVLIQDPELWRALIYARARFKDEDSDADSNECSDEYIERSESDGWNLFRAPPSVLSDHKLMVIACRKVPKDVANVSSTLLSSQGFLQEAIAKKPEVVVHLPPASRAALPDQLVGAAAAKYYEGDYEDDETTVQLRLLNGLGSEIYSRRSFQKAWFAAGGLQISYFPSHVYADPELMTLFCEKQDAWCFEELSATLQSNRGFLDELIPKKPCVILHLPKTTVQTFPELITDNLRHFFPSKPRVGDCEEIVDLLGPEIYTTPSFLKVWFSSGGPFLAKKFPYSLKDDREVFAMIAENATPDGCLCSFEHASSRLKNDKELMLKAVANYPWTLKNA